MDLSLLCMSRHAKCFFLNWWKQHRLCFYHYSVSHQKNCVLCSWLKWRRFKLNTEFLRLVFIREISSSFCGKKKGISKKNKEKYYDNIAKYFTLLTTWRKEWLVGYRTFRFWTDLCLVIADLVVAFLIQIKKIWHIL